MTNTLTTTEADALRSAELIVDDGLAAFVNVGRALLRIRDGNLFRATDANFEAYCLRRFKLSPSRASEVISAATVATQVRNSEPEAPEIVRASHAEELAKLPEAEQGEAWAEVCEATGGKPTAKDVAAVVARRLARPDDEQDEQQQPPEPDCNSGGDETATEWIERGDAGPSKPRKLTTTSEADRTARNKWTEFRTFVNLNYDETDGFMNAADEVDSELEALIRKAGEA